MPAHYSLLIRHGTLIDGTRAQRYAADDGGGGKLRGIARAVPERRCFLIDPRRRTWNT
jgi:hypothetical protein